MFHEFSVDTDAGHSDVDNVAEFLSYRGYNNTHRDRVILSDNPMVAPGSPYYPSGHNILAAMDWLVSEPGCTLFMHYSGHGGQVQDVDSNRSTGLDDSLVPVDFEYNGQLSSTLLHRHLVTCMAPGCTLFVLMVSKFCVRSNLTRITRSICRTAVTLVLRSSFHLCTAATWMDKSR
jgi:hypothetical protein